MFGIKGIRAKTEYDGDRTIITIPPKKSIFNKLVLIIMTVIWLWGVLIGLGLCFFEDINGIGLLFCIFWMCAWTYGGFRGVQAVMFSAFGKEIITIDRDEVSIKLKSFLYKESTEYDRSLIKDVRLTKDSTPVRNTRSRTLVGKISFEYDMLSVDCAYHISTEEAASIIKQHFAWAIENNI